MLKGRLLLEWSAIALLATLLIFASVYSGLTRRFDNLIYDVASTWRAAPASDQILIVAIDNQSLASLGKWQWPRTLHAALLDRLSQSNARPAAIAYDVLFTEAADAQSDAAVAAAMKRGAPVLLPVLYQTPGLNGASHDFYPPVEPYAAAAQGLGTVNLLFDEDGLVRRAQLETRSDTERRPHLMEMTHRAALGYPSRTYQALIEGAAASDQPDGGTMLIPFLPEGAFRRVSFSTVLAGEVPADFFKGKMVLVGVTAPGLGDRYPVPGPAGSTMSGIEIQANMLSGLLSQRFIRPAPRWAALSGALLPIWLLMAGFLQLRPGRILVMSLLLIAAVCAVSFAGLLTFGVWLPPGPALLGLIIVYPLWGWRRLQALSSFVARQAHMLRAEPALGRTVTLSGAGLDSVAAEAAELGQVIGTMRGIQRFMSDVVRGFPDPVCVVDAGNRITLANAAAQDVLGGAIEGEQLQPLLASLTHARSGQQEDLVLADGRTFLIRQAPLQMIGDQSGGAIVRLADISRLKAADRERERMLEFLSHDMRSPQAAIISLLDMQGAELKDSILWQRIQDHAQQTLKLADDFVQQARLEAISDFTHEVDIAAAMAEAIDRCWPAAQQKQIKLISQGLDQEAFVRGDQSALVRAFANLIDNAIKYTPHGTKVSCSVEQAQQVICRIQDEGPGIAPERLANIFEAYGARGTKSISGAGLGLAFVKTTMDRHHAAISCTSAAGVGTCFEMRFALLDAEPA